MGSRHNPLSGPLTRVSLRRLFWFYMAERRMFCKEVIDSDAFLDMPLSTQALYFHLSMRADDDGFVNNPKKIMRMVNSSQNDFELLVAKRYVLTFESGVIVIKHWKMHNYIQKDRYKPTAYIEEKESLTLKDNKTYTEMDTECIHPVRVGKVRVGKSKDSIESAQIDADFQQFWSAYPRKKNKDDARKAYKKRHNDMPPISDLIIIIENNKQTTAWTDDGGQYIPYPATWINRGGWQDEIEESRADITRRILDGIQRAE